MKFITYLSLGILLSLGNTHNWDSSYSLFQPTLDNEPIFAGERVIPNQTIWSPDGTTLYFTALDETTHSYKYVLASKQLTELNAPYLTYSLTIAEQSKFNAASPIAYTSPNHRYIVYTSTAQVCGGEGGCASQMAFGNLGDGEHTLIDMPIGDLDGIHWSADNSAFVILLGGHYGGLGGVFYISVPNTFEGAINPILLMNYDAGGEGFVDISPDGNRVLLREQWDGFNTGLYLWDVSVSHKPKQFSALDSPLILRDTPIAGAAFLPDRSALLVFADRGIIQYDLPSQTSILWYSGLDIRRVGWSLFSPDAKYVAVLARPAANKDSTCLVYVLPLNSQTIGSSYPYRSCHAYG